MSAAAQAPTGLTSSNGVHSVLRPHMPELDAVRGLAILGVLFYHAFYWARDFSLYSAWQYRFLLLMSPGQFGVNLFFVLSGFLITGILLDSRTRTDYYRRFYFRRALRILPAYYLTLLILVVFGIGSRGFLLVSLAFSSNMAPLFGLAIAYPVLWSLAVEEHFYMVWPTIVRQVSTTKLLWFLGVICVLSPVSRVLYRLHALHASGANPEYGAFTWNHLDGLALGAILALVLRRPGFRRSSLQTIAGGLIGLATFLAATGYPFGILTRQSLLGAALQHVWWNLASAALLTLLLWLGSGDRKSLAAPSLLVFFGGISYGLYLYHLFAFWSFDYVARRFDVYSRFHLTVWEQTWIRAVVAAAIAVLFAYLSRRFFEEPFLRMKSRQPSRPAIQQNDGSLTPAAGTAILASDDRTSSR